MYKFLLLSFFMVVAYAQNKAIVYIFDPLRTNLVTGNVTFEEGNGTVNIVGTVSGLSPGLHGFHVHEFGNIASGCLATGSHFNPTHQNHGAPDAKVRHVGDLGNIVADCDGIARINFSDEVISLDGTNNIIGRGLVVHSKADDLGLGGNEESLKTGNAGTRLACGVIGIN